MSTIEWTESTWNPVTGCTRVSKGCDLCYAATLTKRLASMGSEKYKGLINNGKNHFNGVVKTHHDTLGIPLNTNRSTTYFVNSMSDLFHPAVPADFILKVFEVMKQASHHTFQILTKRPERMRDLMPSIWHQLSTSNGESGDKASPLDNVWLGTSVEDSAVIERIDALVAIDAAVRFLSCEPLLGPLENLALEGIHWVIVGGESGPGARPFNLAWAEDIISQCKDASIACFVKQVGANPYISSSGDSTRYSTLKVRHGKGGDPDEWPSSVRVREYPEVRLNAT